MNRIESGGIEPVEDIPGLESLVSCAKARFDSGITTTTYPFLTMYQSIDDVVNAISDTDLARVAANVASQTQLSQESKSEIMSRHPTLDKQDPRNMRTYIFGFIELELEARHPEILGEEELRAKEEFRSNRDPNDVRRFVWINNKDKVLERINLDREAMGLKPLKTFPRSRRKYVASE